LASSRKHWKRRPPVLADLAQASQSNITSALLGARSSISPNILLVAAIDIAGMACPFRSDRLALVLGVGRELRRQSMGNLRCSRWCRSGSNCKSFWTQLPIEGFPVARPTSAPKGWFFRPRSAYSWDFFYRFVAASMYSDFEHPEPGLLAYAAVFVFALAPAKRDCFEHHRNEETVHRDAGRFADYLRAICVPHLTGYSAA